MDLAGEFRAIRDINQEIRRLTLASYAPLRYVLPTSRRPTTPNTAPRCVAAKVSSARRIVRKA